MLKAPQCVGALLLTVTCYWADFTQQGQEYKHQILQRSSEPEKTYTVFTDKKVTWYQALAICSYKGMRLATTMNENENKQLVDLIKSSSKGSDGWFWISASDLGKYRKFVWMSTGCPVKYANWYTTEPNGGRNTSIHCVHIWPPKSYKWADTLCEHLIYYACESCDECL